MLHTIYPLYYAIYCIYVLYWWVRLYLLIRSFPLEPNTSTELGMRLRRITATTEREYTSGVSENYHRGNMRFGEEITFLYEAWHSYYR